MSIRCDNGRQIRIMDGYPPGTRPDPITEGPYAVISQGNGPPSRCRYSGTRSCDAEIIAHLLDEMEEYYGAFDHYPLYLLGLGAQRRRANTRTEARSGSAGI